MATPSTVKTKYAHLELDNDIVAGIAGYYTPQKEVRLQYNGREVLYVIGQAVIESSCCGTGRWLYAVVPGYIVSWQNTKNEAGLLVSEVEPVRDDKAREKIRRIIETSENSSLISFW